MPCFDRSISYPLIRTPKIVFFRFVGTTVLSVRTIRVFGILEGRRVLRLLLLCFEEFEFETHELVSTAPGAFVSGMLTVNEWSCMFKV
jgi:hypothetical protein